MPHNSFLRPEYFIDYFCEKWIPCQAVTSILCLLNGKVVSRVVNRFRKRSFFYDCLKAEVLKKKFLNFFH